AGCGRGVAEFSADDQVEAVEGRGPEGGEQVAVGGGPVALAELLPAGEEDLDDALSQTGGLHPQVAVEVGGPAGAGQLELQSRLVGGEALVGLDVPGDPEGGHAAGVTDGQPQFVALLQGAVGAAEP